MIPDATFDPVPDSGRTLRLRFSLLALFLFVTLVCLLLAWWVQPNRVVATALFRVSSRPPTILGDEFAQSRDEQEFEIVKKTQLALLKSYFVLNAAVRKLGVASLPILQVQADPIDWLQRHLEVRYPEDAEILEISLRGPEGQSSDLVRIVDAVAKAYSDEVVFKERSRRLNNRDLLARSVGNLNNEIADKAEVYLDIVRESAGWNDGVLQRLDMNRIKLIDSEILRLESDQLQVSEQKENAAFFEKRIAQLKERQAELEKNILTRNGPDAKLEMRQRELKQLQLVADELSAMLKRLDIEANAPQRIELVQPATISPE